MDYFDNIEINFNLYRDVQINQWMCSRNCPCADVEVKEEWESISPLTLALDFDRNLNFQFGPLVGETFTVDSFEECILNADEN